jgi:hypothetical protein
MAHEQQPFKLSGRKPKLKDYLITAAVFTGFAVYITHGQSNSDPNLDYTHLPSTTISSHKSVNDMSPAEEEAWLSKQNPHNPLPQVDTHYNQYSPDEINALGSAMGMDMGGSTSGQAALNSGDATFTGAVDDVQTGSVDTQSIPAGYHIVKAHTTKKGKVVKAHLVRSRTSTKKTSRKSSVVVRSSSSSSSVDWSQPIVSRSVDVRQRRQISQQNFPNVANRISSGDSTVILGSGF